MTLVYPLLSDGMAILGMVTALWVLSLLLRNASIVDIFWGFGFVVLAWKNGGEAESLLTPDRLLLAVVTVWGLRLCLWLAWRNIGHGEDYRYAAWRKDYGPRFWWVSFFQVFLLQGAVMWVVSLPVTLGIRGQGGDAAGPLMVLGAVGVAIGLFFETVGDWQLARFKKDPDRQGRVLDSGLWRYTRHPNYFGDSVVWWGLYLLGIAAGAPLWTAIGPLLMTWLLLRVSGVALLEKSLKQRRPGYSDYIRRTSAFFPLPPKRTVAAPDHLS